MTVLACAGFGCDRLISVSRIKGGNPTAVADPEHWSVRFTTCSDCPVSYCDRCVPDRPGVFGRRSRRLACRECGGRLVDGQRFQDVRGRPRREAIDWAERGLGLAEAGDDEGALAAFDRALALRPTHPAAHLWRGRALSALGRDAEALAAFDAAIGLDDGKAEAYFERGNALAAADRRPEAVEAYRRAAALAPRYSAARVNEGISLLALDRVEEALAALDAAIDLEESGAAVRFAGYVRQHGYRAKGEALLRLGRPEDALAALEVAVGAGPDDASMYDELATVLRALGRDDDAARAERIATRTRERDQR